MILLLAEFNETEIKALMKLPNEYKIDMIK